MTRKIFTDTNVFIRFYLQDNPKLSVAARNIILASQTGKCTMVICSATILEIVWLLLSFYKNPKENILAFIDEILHFPNLEIIDRKIIERTVAMFTSKNIDITDAYWLSLMEQENIKEIFSFDHDFDKIPGFKRLEKI